MLVTKCFRDATQRLRAVAARRPAAVAAGLLMLWPAHSARSAEPVERFLTVLKDQRMFDMATLYLDYLQQHNLLPQEMRDNLAYEKLSLQQQMAASATTADQQMQQLGQIQQGLRQFIESSAGNPRRVDAQMQLADSYFQQGDRALTQSKRTADAAQRQELIAAAREAFNKAEKTFAQAVDDMAGELRQLLSEKSNDTAIVDRRNYLQQTYRRSQIMIGQARRLTAETHGEGSSEYQAGMASAQKQFAEVMEKASRVREPGAYYLAALYNGQALLALDQNDAALESLQRVADLDGSGVLRTLKVQATAALTRALANEEVKKYPAAIERAEAALKTKPTSERSAEWDDLNLALQAARIDYAESLKAAGKPASEVRSLQQAAASDLQLMVRVGGQAAVDARSLLSKLGVDPIQQSERALPPTRSFGEAIAAANERYVRRDQDALTIEVLRAQADPASDAEISRIESARDTAADQAIELYMRAMRLFNPASDSREDLTTARSRLAVLLYQRQRMAEAAAVADIVARSSRGSQAGDVGAQLAIIAYQQLLTSQPALDVSQSLTSLSEYLLAGNPSEDVAKIAGTAVLKAALDRGDWDAAEKSLEYLSGDPVTAAAVRRDLGYVFYAQLLQAQKQARDAGGPLDTPEIQGLADRAANLLRPGVEALTADVVDARGVDAANALVTILLDRGELDAAEKVLNAPAGPLQTVEEGKVELPVRTKMNSLQKSLELAVARAANEGRAIDAQKVEQTVAKLQKIAAAENSTGELSQVLISLAGSLTARIDAAKSPQAKSQLAGSVRVLMQQLMSVSKDPTILFWSATTLRSLGESLAKANAAAEAKQTLSAAVEGLEKLDKITSANPASLEALGVKRTQLQALQASALMAAGRHQEAFDLHRSLLQENPMQLLVQMEASRNLQQWGMETKDAEKIKQSIFGAVPADKGQNVIWGWGPASIKLNGQPDLQQYFFECRYELAAARLKLANVDPSVKDKQLASAIKDIRNTYVNFPELGGEQMKAKFEALTRQLQTATGEQVVGLKAFDA